MKNSTILGANEEYIEQSKHYGKKDVALALILYVIMIIEFLLLGYLFTRKGAKLTEVFVFIATGVVSLNIIGFVLFFCSVRKQRLVTVGFNKSQARESLILGIILFILVGVIGCIWIIISDSAIQTNFSIIFMRVVYYLIFIGFMEELVFRGYIGTRFYGFFSDKRMAVITVGIMFSLMHVPFHMVMA